MHNNQKYARHLKEAGYERKAIAFKLSDRVPENVESYGNAQSFHCAVVAEIWEGRPPFYLTRENILCGGALYSGMGWCTNSFPLVCRTKGMTFNMGDETSRVLMNLELGEMYCFMHYAIVPQVIDNLQNIQTGLAL